MGAGMAHGSSKSTTQSPKKHLYRESSQPKIWKGKAKREHHSKEGSVGRGAEQSQVSIESCQGTTGRQKVTARYDAMVAALSGAAKERFMQSMEKQRGRRQPREENKGHDAPSRPLTPSRLA